ncbi:MAG: glycosyltransferase [Pseudomonadota bacterium]
MSTVKVSVCIPYKQRIDNIRLVFEALANQTINKRNFEVIVGAMEYSSEFLDVCKNYIDRFNLISVLSNKDFSIPRARNLAMRQATGEIILQMDADTLLPPVALENLYTKHFLFGQNICAVGQVIGYDNNEGDSIESVSVKPYHHYTDVLQKIDNAKENPLDSRFNLDHIIPWSFGWTGLIALRHNIVIEHQLYFDEEFHGWGVDDLEWSYRICRNGIPIVLCKDMYALHLPHVRNSITNNKAEKRNYIGFLRKWPSLDVELAKAFGDVRSNEILLQLNKLGLINSDMTHRFCCMHGIEKGRSVLLVGIEMNSNSKILDNKCAQVINNWKYVETIPLIGMGLPYTDRMFQIGYVSPYINLLSEPFKDAVYREVKRVVCEIVQLEKNIEFSKH